MQQTNLTLLYLSGLYLAIGLLFANHRSPVRQIITWWQTNRQYMGKKTFPSYVSFLIAMLLYPFILREHFKRNRLIKKIMAEPWPEPRLSVVPAWLGDVLTVDEAEHYLATFYGEDTPIGYHYNDLQQLLKKRQEGDVLQCFDSGPESWEMLCGCAGIALVRNGVPVDEIVLIIN